ncbi:MAG: M56 family metallopeptidase [Planctomycetota bacterium]|jgi:beta-lactamase regulating signal transducer with metallopeptidase domain
MNQIIHDFLMDLNNVGWSFCYYALRMFVQSSVLIILLIIIDFMLRKKVRSVFRYCMWMLVFVKLILPPSLSLPTGIGYWCGDSLSTERIISKPTVDNISTTESIRSDIFEHSVTSTGPSQARPSHVASETSVVVTPVMSEMSEDSAAITEPSQGQPSEHLPVNSAFIESILTILSVISWQAVVFLIWLTGIFVFSLLLIQRMFSVLGLIAQSEPAKGRLLETLDQCRRRVGIGRNVGLRLSSHAHSPAVCGLFKPIILMPSSLLEELSKDKLRAVLIHELVHIKRCDLWINFVQTFLQIIYFYNPFVWFANAFVRRLREQAVDEAVLATLGTEAKSYSNTLIDIAELAFFRTTFGLCFIGVAESKKSLQRRIRHMLTRPIPKNARVGVFGTFVIFVIAAVLLPMARAEKSAESEVANDQDITSTATETVTPFVLRIRAFIDGSDYIKIQGDKLWYEHLKWDLPGKWWDRSKNVKYDEPTYIDGEAWKPDWEGRMSKPYIMKQVILPKEVNEQINLTKISGRGTVSIAETPKPDNDYTLSILLDDNRYNQAQWYEVVIESGPGDTTKESAKGGSISSSTVTLLQIPAANDLPGDLIFQGQYKHLSRGREYGEPSVLLLKKTQDKRITAVAQMPLRKATIIASGDQENRFAHYKIEQPALGDRSGYLMDLKLLDNKVLLTRRGIRQDVDDEELKVPEGTLFNPNTRPDAYCAANILLRGFNLEKGKSKEFHVYDWDNTGEAFADYTIRVKHAGTESVDVPAGRFEANHFVLTQVTSANTWFKKRAGHVTDFWVLDNCVIVRVLRHREPYEIQLLEYTVPEKLPGHLGAATKPALKKKITSTDGQAKTEATDTVLLSGEEGKILAFDDFNDSLSLDWEVLHNDPTHYSLTKNPGTLTITTQRGGFSWTATDYDNLFLIDCPALPSSGVQITTCISGFNPNASWQQAGLLFWSDDNNYLKWVCQFGPQHTFSYLGETKGVRKSHRSLPVPQGAERFWLRMTKRGDRYQFLSSVDGKSFVPFNAPADPHGTPMTSGTLPWGDGSVDKIGLFAGNGLDSQAPEIDASFEFFEVRVFQVEAESQSESVKNEEPGKSQASTIRASSKEETGKRYQNDIHAFFSEIDQTYPFFDLKNIREDWNQTKERLTVQVRKCNSDSEFMRIILDATRCLRDSHVRIYNNSVDIPWPEPEYYPLIGFMPAQGNSVVIMMSPPGQEDSLPVGTVVKSIDGVDAREYLDERAKETWEAGGHPSPQRARLFAYRIPLKGPKDTKHKIIVQRRDKEEEIVLECTKEARGWPHTYNLPGKMKRVGRSFFYTKLPSGVGYMYLRRVDSSVTQGMSEAVKAYPDVRGWIVDLRGNGGGGYDSKLIQTIKDLQRPVVGLIDAGCMSAGETLARDIRRNANARLFGSRTAGSSSSKRNWQFPSGIASVIIPTRSRWRGDSKPIEYNGIEPDEKIEAVPDDLLKGLNTGILRAEKYILSQSSKTLKAIPPAKEVTVSGGNAVNEDDSNGATITGRVLDTRGNIVPGPSPNTWIKLAHADSSSGKSGFDWTALDGAGQFKIEGVPPGSYFFVVEGIEVGYEKRAENDPVVISAGQVIEDIDVIVETKEEPGNISGHVLDARTGKALKEFSVEVTGAESAGEHSSTKHQVKFDESEDGFFSIEKIPSGIATLQISAAGYESEEFQLRIRGGGTRKTVFYLGGGSMRVRVRHNGRGKQGAFVKARYLGEGPGFYSRGIEFGEGSYEIKGLREGNYLVLAGFQSVGAPVTYNFDYTLVKIEAGKTARTDFKFQENAVIRGRFTFPDNVQYGRVCVFREPDENHNESLSESERSIGTVMYIKKDGHYEISNLPPGTYKVVGECIPKGTTIGTRSRNVTLGEGRTGEVDFDFL